MSIMEGLKRLKGKRSIEKVSRDELRVEKIRLDQQEAKYIQRVEKLEAEKAELFRRGVNEGSQRKQAIIARRIKELDAQAKGLDRQLQAISHQVRVVNGLLMIKEEMGTMSKEAESLISKLPLEELASYVEKSTVQGEFQREKLAEIAHTLEEGRGVLAEPLGGEDEDVRQIMSLFQQAKSSAEVDEEGAVKSGLEQVDKILSKEPSELE
jgi:hypothetical protein